MCANKYEGTEVTNNMTMVTRFPPIRSVSIPRKSLHIEPLRIATEESQASCESEIPNSF